MRLKKETAKKKSILMNTIHCGDCVAVLKNIPGQSINTVITSPPYFQQREYTGIGIGMEKKMTSYIESLIEGFTEIVRVVKKDGNIIYNLGDKIHKDKGTLLIPYRFAISILDKSDVALLNDITWAKKNPVPRQFEKRLVSSTEPFFHFIKSKDYYYALGDYMKSSAPSPNIKSGDKLGLTYFEIIKKSNLTIGEKRRANKAIKETIEEVKQGGIVGFRVKVRGIHAPAFGGMAGGRNSQMRENGFTIIKLRGNPLKKDLVSYPVETIKGNGHPAVFPIALIEELIKLTCPVDGIVLDPYCGSGTTLLAAKQQKRKYIGIDINPKYCGLAKDRLKNGKR